MLSEATSGSSRSAGCSRSSTVIVGAPPVVRLITTSDAALIFGRNCLKTAGSCVGRPSVATRACRWTIAAPALAAPIAPSAISSGVTGRWGDIVGVWIAPVTAQVMMTFLCGAAMIPPSDQPLHVAAHGERLAGDVSAGRGGEEQRHVRDILGGDERLEADGFEEALRHLLEAHAE